MTYAELPSGAVSMACSEALDAHGVFSAHGGDYFWADPQTEIICSICEAPMVLVKHVEYFEVVA